MSQTISATQLYNTVGRVYGPKVQVPLAALFTQYGFGETVDVFQETPGDGVVSIPYETFQEKSLIRGVLRFASDGSVYDGLHKLNTKLGAGVGSLLVSAALGETELGRKPSGLDGGLLKSALSLYECLESGSASKQTCLNKVDGEVTSLRHTRANATRKAAVQNEQSVKAREQKAKEDERSTNNEKVRSLLSFADQVKNIAIREHTPWIIPWGMNKDDVIEILNEELPIIAATPSDTLEGSRERVLRAMKMANRLLGISEGQDSCKEISGCSAVKGSEPSCSAGEHAYAPVTYYYNGEGLRYESGGCVKKSESKGPFENGSDRDWGPTLGAESRAEKCR